VRWLGRLLLQQRGVRLRHAELAAAYLAAWPDPAAATPPPRRSANWAERSGCAGWASGSRRAVATDNFCSSEGAKAGVHVPTQHPKLVGRRVVVDQRREQRRQLRAPDPALDPGEPNGKGLAPLGQAAVRLCIRPAR
jgi:hypothetical protein